MNALAFHGAVLTAIGVHLSVGFYRDVRDGSASERWPKTRGRVVGWGAHHGSLARRDPAAALRYEYEVDGRTYQSQRYDYSGRASGSGAVWVLSRYRVGDAVTVRYDPDDPSRAVIVPGADDGAHFRLSVAVVVLVVGLLVLGVGIVG